jgi:dienelactone hydrolase
MTYDPFVPGQFPVAERAIRALDTARDRLFPCDIWRPAVPGTFPLIVFSHHSGGHRRAATFLQTHLASHGYVVAAMDHSEVVAKELARKEGDTAGQLAARVEAILANRVPDIRFLLDNLLSTESSLDSTQIGLVGHSLGGWTVLATPEVEPRVRAVVALAPGGSSQPKPGVIRAKLTFDWGRDVPTLYLAAENDVPIPPDAVQELFERTQATKQMVTLRRADHAHFMDNVEEMHETGRAMLLTRPELVWMAKEMRPITELCSGEQAHTFVRGLTLCHMDAFLKQLEDARRWLSGDIQGELAKRGVDGMAPNLST